MDNNSVTVITVITVQSKIKTSFIVASDSAQNCLKSFITDFITWENSVLRGDFFRMAILKTLVLTLINVIELKAILKCKGISHCLILLTPQNWFDAWL